MQEHVGGGYSDQKAGKVIVVGRILLIDCWLNLRILISFLDLFFNFLWLRTLHRVAHHVALIYITRINCKTRVVFL